MECCSRQRAELDQSLRALTDANLLLFEAESDLRALNDYVDGALTTLLKTLGLASVSSPEAAAAAQNLSSVQARIAAEFARQKLIDAEFDAAAKALFELGQVGKLLPAVRAAAEARLSAALQAVIEGGKRFTPLFAEEEAALAALKKALPSLTQVVATVIAGILASLLTALGQRFAAAEAVRVLTQNVTRLKQNVDALFNALDRCLARCRREAAVAAAGRPSGPAYDLRSTGRIAVAPIGFGTSPRFLTCGVIAGDSLKGSFRGSQFGVEQYHSFAIRGDRLIDLFVDQEANLSLASETTGANHDGFVVGNQFTRVAGGSRANAEAFIWDPSTGLRSSIQAGSVKLGAAYGVADDGTVVGRAAGDDRVLLVRKGKVVARFAVADSLVNGMNGRGDVVCTSLNSLTCFLRTAAGDIVEIPRLPNTFNSFAIGIGPAGHVVGYCAGNDREHAFIWSRGDGLRELPGLGGYQNRANGVNAGGDAVGQVQRAGVNAEVTAVLWPFEAPQPIELQGEISESYRWTLSNATCIDDAGRIGGVGLAPGGLVEGYVLRTRRLDWGVRVTVTMRADPAGSPEGPAQAVYTGFLVAIEPLRIIMQRGIRVQLDDSVTVEESISIGDVATIELARPADGFNVYIAQPDDDAADWLMGEFVRFEPGVGYVIVKYEPDGKRTKLTVSSMQLRALYAIPRAVGENPTPRDIKDMLDDSGRGFSVPPQVLYALSHQESLYEGKTWRQFAPALRSVCRSVTIVTPLGGIGLMQLRGRAALQISHPQWDGEDGSMPPDPLTHLYRLAASVRYNIESGARVLRARKQRPPLDVRLRRSPWFEPAPQVIEHWFFALARYGDGKPYATKVWKLMAKPPYAVPVEAVTATTPKVEAPDTAYPAHIDPEFTATVRLVLPKPEIKASGDRRLVTVRPLTTEIPVRQVYAGLVQPEGYSAPAELTTEDSVVWSADISPDAEGVDTFLGTGTPRVTITASRTLFYVDVYIGFPQGPVT